MIWDPLTLLPHKPKLTQAVIRISGAIVNGIWKSLNTRFGTGVVIGLTVAASVALGNSLADARDRAKHERYIGSMLSHYLCELLFLDDKFPSFSAKLDEYVNMVHELQSAIEEDSTKLHFSRKREILRVFEFRDAATRRIDMLPPNVSYISGEGLETVIGKLQDLQLKGFMIWNMTGCRHIGSVSLEFN